MIGGLTTTAFFVAIGSVLFLSGGLPQRSPKIARWTIQEQRERKTLYSSPCLVDGTSLPPAAHCLLGTASAASGYSVVLWGDSHAAHLAPALDEIGQQLGITIREITKKSCPPSLGAYFWGERRAGGTIFNDNALDAISADKHVRVVVLAARWDAGAEGNWAFRVENEHLITREARQLFIVSLRRTLEAPVASGRQVIIVGQVPLAERDPVTCIGQSRFNHQNESPCLVLPVSSTAKSEGLVNHALSAAAGANPGVRIVHP